MGNGAKAVYTAAALFYLPLKNVLKRSALIMKRFVLTATLIMSMIMTGCGSAGDTTAETTTEATAAEGETTAEGDTGDGTL